VAMASASEERAQRKQHCDSVTFHRGILSSLVKPNIARFGHQPGGLGPWNPTSRKGSEKWGTRQKRRRSVAVEKICQINALEPDAASTMSQGVKIDVA
jgi:hypothetical protein